MTEASLVKSYNGLPDLVSADAMLSERNRHEGVNALLSMIMKHDLSHYVGIRLLHKHNEIVPDEVMAEDYTVDDAGFALITRARTQKELDDNYVANSWTYIDGKFVPVEFSHGLLLKRPDINPHSMQEFFSELAAEIEANDVTGILGPSLLGSDFVDSHRPPGSTMMMEFTAQDDRANVLRFTEAGWQNDGTGVQTHWCWTKDGSFTEPTMACTRICPSVQNPPKHQGTFIHNQTADPTPTPKPSPTPSPKK